MVVRVTLFPPPVTVIAIVAEPITGLLASIEYMAE